MNVSHASHKIAVISFDHVRELSEADILVGVCLFDFGHEYLG